MRLQPLVSPHTGPILGQVLHDGQKLARQLQDESLHVYALSPKDDVVALSFSDLLPERHAPDASIRSQAQTRDRVEAKQVRMGRQREDRLEEGHGAQLGRVVPKDASVMPKSYLMGSRGDSLSLGYIRQMAQVGQLEGFNIEVLSRAPQTVARQLREPNITVIPTKIPSSTWTEDYGERTVTGKTVVPAWINSDLVEEAVLPDRVKRYYGAAKVPAKADQQKLRKQMPWRFPRAHFSIHGAVSGSNLQRLLISRSQSQGEPIGETASHIEGGNMLTGTLPNGQGYALIGQDSVAVTRAKLSQDLGHRVGQREALGYIAQDFGLLPENVHAIEQPGEFHVDMRILCAAPGQVILNDAKAAYKLQAQGLREAYAKAKPADLPEHASTSRKQSHQQRMKVWTQRGRRLKKQLFKMRAEAQRRARFEELTAKDLVKAGLRVDRMPAVFVDPRNPERDVANFVNGRGGTNENGERFFIGLGARPSLEILAADYLMRKLPTGFSKIYFLDSKLTQGTLDLSGGIKCRTKPSGQVASGELLLKPFPSRFTVVTPSSSEFH